MGTGIRTTFERLKRMLYHIPEGIALLSVCGIVFILAFMAIFAAIYLFR